FLNCTIPALVNIRVGSLRGTSGLEETISWPFLAKKSRKVRRMSFAVCMAFYTSIPAARAPGGEGSVGSGTNGTCTLARGGSLGEWWSASCGKENGQAVRPALGSMGFWGPSRETGQAGPDAPAAWDASGGAGSRRGRPDPATPTAPARSRRRCARPDRPYGP